MEVIGMIYSDILNPRLNNNKQNVFSITNQFVKTLPFLNQIDNIWQAYFF